MSDAVLAAARWLGHRSRIPGTGRLLLALYPCRADAPRHATGWFARGDGLRMRLDSRRWIEWCVLFREYEPQVGALIEAVLEPGELAVDVGANIGVHTLTMARRVGATGRVLAFEPNPAAATALEENLAANALQQVTLERAALGRTRGTARLRVPRAGTPEDANPGLASLVALDTPHDEVEVPVVTLDAVVPASPGSLRVALVKIDVQGFEPEVLAGMDAVLRRDAPVLVLEHEPGAWLGGFAAFRAQMARLEAELGYRLFVWSADAGRLERRPAASLTENYLELVAIHAGRVERLSRLLGGGRDAR